VKISGGIRGDTPTPLDAGLLGWSLDPAHVGAGTILVAGKAQMAWVPVHGYGTVSKIDVCVTTAGASLTVSGLALYSSARNLLSNAPLATTFFQTTGLRQGVLTTPQAFTPATKGFYVACWAVGSTMPTMARGGNTFAAVNLLGGSPVVPVRFGVSAASSFTTGTPPSGPLAALTADFALLAGLE